MVSDPSKRSFRSAAGAAADKASGTADDLSTSELVNKASDSINESVGAAGDLYATGAGRAREAMADLPGSLSDATAAGERLVLRGRQRLDHGVRKQPVEALLLAGAIGYLVGWAASRG